MQDSVVVGTPPAEEEKMRIRHSVRLQMGHLNSSGNIVAFLYDQNKYF